MAVNQQYRMIDGSYVNARDMIDIRERKAFSWPGDSSHS